MAKKALRSGGTALTDPDAAVADIARQVVGEDTELVLIFCSPQYDLDALAAAIKRSFQGIRVVGCTTAGEITPFGYISGGISAVGFGAGDFAADVDIIEDLSEFRLSEVLEKTTAAMIRRDLMVATRFRDEPVRSFTMLLVDGLSACEEMLASAVGSILTDTPLVGGSAGDDLDFRRTYVFHDGRWVSNAALLLLFVTPRRFSVFKSENYVPTEKRMVVTGVDSGGRRITELNAEPAAQEYARALNLGPEPLTPHVFAAHPVVVRVGGKYHVRSIQKVNPDDSLTLYCAVDEGLVLTLGESVDLLDSLRQLFQQIKQEVGTPELIIGYDCVLRNIDVEQIQLKRYVSDILVRNKVIGFCTYGEQYNAMHINQTFTGIAFGAK